ncbi:hypothetical protein [Prauserella flavalba]|uniref:Uncharacterized protein n=1 Tax=Prauserella flavalba TaxID=1477506 RepID=A0A318LFR3_9PSEU|nr:hypothetical protein [Prauserella flavalba]PXY17967.1 hypothetical protein BA062_36535 [Prauserella flavalba]
MPPTFAELETSWNESFSEAKDAIGQIQNFFTQIDNETSMAVEILSSAVKVGVKRLGELKDDLVAMYNEAEPHQLPVISLMKQSFAWLDNVKSPISNLSPQVTIWRDQNLSSWGGGAGRAYLLEKTTQQKAAIDDVSKNADKISEWLMDIAQRNVEYMLEFVDKLGVIVGHYAGAAAAAATLVGIAEAIGDAADAVAAVFAEMVDQLTDVASRFMLAVSDERKIDSITTDNTALPGGKWPESVVG